MEIEADNDNNGPEPSERVKQLMNELGNELSKKGIVVIAFDHEPASDEPGMNDISMVYNSSGKGNRYAALASQLANSIREVVNNGPICAACFGLHDGDDPNLDLDIGTEEEEGGPPSPRLH